MADENEKIDDSSSVDDTKKEDNKDDKKEESVSFKVGDKVTTTATTDWNGTHLASFVRNTTYQIIQIGGTGLSDARIVIGINGEVTAAVNVNTLSLVADPKDTDVESSDKEKDESDKKNEKKDEKDNENELDEIVSHVLANGDKLESSSKKFATTTIETSAVQYLSEKLKATNVSEKYNYDINSVDVFDKDISLTQDEIQRLDSNDPSIVQNSAKFPEVKGFDSNVNFYRYNYYMDYEKDGITQDLDNLHRSINTDITSRRKLLQYYTSKYDKFKKGSLNPNDALTKSFAHVFFIRPDCNLYEQGYGNKKATPKLLSSVRNLSEYYYAFKHSPDLIRQLTQADAGYPHEFMMLLSNKARSFSISDQYIGSDTYGASLTGYKVAYGRGDAESKGAGKFSINYIDNRDLDIYHLHKMWIDYIGYVYRGKLCPKDDYMINRVIDYATCVYYILCAEDGETIIFWSKYYGVFPTEAPSSGFSYTSDNGGGVKQPELQLEYQYSWKEDFNPLSLIEFNTHSNKSNLKYISNYQTNKLGTGYTWAGAPFIETFNGDANVPYTFKLRFRPES